MKVSSNIFSKFIVKVILLLALPGIPILIAYLSNVDLPSIDKFLEDGSNIVLLLGYVLLSVKVLMYSPKPENKD